MCTALLGYSFKVWRTWPRKNTCQPCPLRPRQTSHSEPQSRSSSSRSCHLQQRQIGCVHNMEDGQYDKGKASTSQASLTSHAWQGLTIVACITRLHWCHMHDKAGLTSYAWHGWIEVINITRLVLYHANDMAGLRSYTWQGWIDVISMTWLDLNHTHDKIWLKLYAQQGWIDLKSMTRLAWCQKHNKAGLMLKV